MKPALFRFFRDELYQYGFWVVLGSNEWITASMSKVHDRFRVALNEIRHEVGFDWEEMNEIARDEFGACVVDLNVKQVFRLYKDLCNLRKFQIWKAERALA